MSIKVRYRDAVIEAETGEDLQAVLKTLGLLDPQGSESASVTERLGQFSKRLVGEQVRLLQALRASPDGLTDAEVCVALGIERTQLGGILKAISRKATSAGLDADRYVMAKETVRAADGTRAYHFRLRPEMRDALPPG